MSGEDTSGRAQSLLRRGRSALGAGAVVDALKDIEAAYDLAVADRNRGLEAEALVELARGLCARGAPDQAMLCLEQAAEAARGAGAPAIEADARLLEAELLERLQDRGRARARVEDAARLLDEAQQSARSAGDKDRALDLADRARRTRELLGRVTAAPEPPDTGDRARQTSVARRDETRRVRKDALADTLYESSRRLFEERDPARVVSRLLDDLVSVLGAERGFVLLSPDEDESAGAEGAEEKRALPSGLRVAAARNFDRNEVRHPEFKVSRSVIEKALASGKPLLVRDAGLDEGLSRETSVLEKRLRSIVCVPFESRRAPVVRGALYFDNRFGEGAFSADDLPPIAAFAAHAAVAVENARLHARAERQTRALDQARARAEDLARKLEARLAVAGDELTRVKARLDDAQGRLGGAAGPGGLVGVSSRIREVFHVLERVKDSDAPVLVLGESGTGKELVARAIHAESLRRDEPFVSENVAAIPESLVESVLFGCEAGAFTGAEPRAGLFELAGSGTIFLDEIGELSLSCQAKLLRVLQEKQIRRLGGDAARPVAARVCAATNRDLDAMVEEGTFREDLLYRLKVLIVKLPPLRDRREDVPVLLESLFAKHGLPGGEKRLAPDARRVLLNHGWPGNVRELENEVRRLVALGGEAYSVEHLTPALADPAASARTAGAAGGAPLTLRDAERAAIVAALRATRGQKGAAAEILGIPRGSLWHRIRALRIADAETRD